MRSYTAFPLDDDVVDYVLSLLPDYTTLLSFRLTCIAINAVFKRHPWSIQRAIAQNLTGDSYCQALSLAQAMSTDEAKKNEGDPTDNTTHLITAEPTTVPNCELGDMEMCSLEKNAQVLRRLEDLFSWRLKDRTSAKTRLSPSESIRLHRAMYRIWFVSITISRDWKTIHVEPAALEQHTQKACNNTFSDCTANDLRDMMSAVEFLLEISHWTASAATGYQQLLPYSTMTCDPSVVLDAFQSVNSACLSFHLTTSPLMSFLTKVRSIISSQNNSNFTVINLPQPIVTNEEDVFDGEEEDEDDEEEENHNDEDLNQHKYPSSAILESAIGGSDLCQKCSGPGGSELWNETNWHYLRGLLPWSSLIQEMKGKLPFNRGIAHDIRSILSPTSFLYDDLLSEIHALRRPTYASWQKTDWLCLSCFRTIINEHLHVWWYHKLIQCGQPIKPNCWYGYNCRTQTHKQEHASRLNHLCEPTRGD